MAGELVPVVMMPRYTTFASASTDQDFTTIAMDVTQYQSAILNVWRTALIGSSPDFKVYFEESTDQVAWSTCSGTSGSGETLSNATEAQFVATLKRRWFRIRVRLSGTNVVASA